MYISRKIKITWYVWFFHANSISVEILPCLQPHWPKLSSYKLKKHIKRSTTFQKMQHVKCKQATSLAFVGFKTLCFEKLVSKPWNQRLFQIYFSVSSIFSLSLFISFRSSFHSFPFCINIKYKVLYHIIQLPFAICDSRDISNASIWYGAVCGSRFNAIGECDGELQILQLRLPTRRVTPTRRCSRFGTHSYFVFSSTTKSDTHM